MPAHLTTANAVAEAAIRPASPKPAARIWRLLAERSPAMIGVARFSPWRMAPAMNSIWLGPGGCAKKISTVTR